MVKEPTFQHSESVVLQLSRFLLQQGLTIYAYNLYSSFPWPKNSYRKKLITVELCVKTEKDYQTLLLRPNIRKGNLGLMNSKGVKICNWKDKRNVLTLSTVPEHSGNLPPSGKKDRNGTEILMPQCVLDYNAAKCGVDKSDQMTSYNTALRRSTKWFRKLAIELLTGTAVVNAWVLYNQFYCQQKTISFTEFKECLVMSLIT
ncbi:PiggyBac transposable element-derived protein 4 [Dictyocoela muelleri]|nr:PiggyBac transposable element-derived protein 4 [Dictyocoela muelleri]